MQLEAVCRLSLSKVAYATSTSNSEHGFTMAGPHACRKYGLYTLQIASLGAMRPMVSSMLVTSCACA